MSPDELDVSSPIPLYFQLKQILAEEMRSGRLAENQLIPSENAMIEQYRVSRTTVRKAIDELVADGLLKRVHGRGTLVARPPVERYPVLLSFSEDMKASGQLPSHRTLTSEIVNAPPQVRMELNLGSDDLCVHLQRALTIDARPVGYSETYIPLSLVAGHEHLFEPLNLDPHSIYRVLEGPEVGLQLVHGIEVANAEAADDRLSTLLKVPPHSPILVVRHVSYDADQHPCESLKLVFGGGHYQYRTEMIRPPGAGWSGRVFIVNEETALAPVSAEDSQSLATTKG